MRHRAIVNAIILILAPAGRDATLASDVLANASVSLVVCEDIDILCENMRPSAAAAIIAEEALTLEAIDKICEVLADQPAWSDLPIIVLMGVGGSSTRRKAETP